MFITLLVVTFLIAAATSTVVALLFSRPINRILSRLVSDELAPMWRRYVLFAIYVVGISGGVRVWDVEKYITPDKEGQILALNSDRWVIEIYKTIIGALQSTAWMLLIFFLFALLAYVVVRGFEWKRTTGSPEKG
jgi:hypothetical protein